MSTDSNSPLYWLPLTWSWPGPPVWRCSRYGRPVCPAVAQSVSHPPHHYRDTTSYQVMIFLKRPADLLHGFGEHLIVLLILLSTSLPSLECLRPSPALNSSLPSRLPIPRSWRTWRRWRIPLPSTTWQWSVWIFYSYWDFNVQWENDLQAEFHAISMKSNGGSALSY